MIREIFTYLSEKPGLPEARAFGHLTQSISLLYRERRCQAAWSTHRAACKNFIAREIMNARHFESVLVLGSGPLHEIPIDLLSQKFKRVVLVDIVHLSSTRALTKHLSNVEFIEHEITELEKELLIKKELIQKIPQKFLDEKWGMVLSVNLMSQLPLHFISYIKKKLKNKFSEGLIKTFLENLTKNHLCYLQSFHCPALLITDTRADYIDRNDAVIESDFPYPHLLLPTSEASWTWNLAPIPEFQKDVGIKMLMQGFVFKNSH